MIDLEKRKRIMQRSIQLGHCICNPKQPCPCDLFKRKNVCLCAGERLEENPEEKVRLTEYVENAGCASKISRSDLKKVLEGLPKIEDPRVLVSADTCDDAGVYLLENGTALVQSVDVFTPVVDDPYTFGAIAAANSVSDIYAMGGIPLTALSVVAFPIETLSHRVMRDMLRGGIDKLEEAGVVVLGGHSIKDTEIKFGFAVTGLIHPERMLTNDRARPGDVLVLTKPLGTGVISFARQLGKAADEAIRLISRSMCELNRAPSEILIEMGIPTATDVTGFGLMGHLSEIAVQSGVAVEVLADQVPVFDFVLEYLRQGMISGAIERNRESAGAAVRVSAGLPPELETLLYDPQTSGGLLIAAPEERAEELVGRLREAGSEHAAVIGRVLEGKAGEILIRKSGEDPAVVREDPASLPAGKPAAQGVEPCCCSSGSAGAGESPPAVSGDAEGDRRPPELFGAFMGTAFAEGAVSLPTKQILAVAMSLLTRCGPCVKAQVKKARSLGIGEDEIQEALWMAVAFGGAPVLMFYESVREELRSDG